MTIYMPEIPFLPKETREKVSCFIKEYIDFKSEKLFDKNGELTIQAYKQAFQKLIDEDIFTAEELRYELFTNYNVLLPLEYFN